MQLVLNTPGAYLRKRDGCFFIRVEEEARLIAPKKVESIVVSTAVKISSDALQMAVEHNIDVVFLDKYGAPYGRLWHCKLGSTARIRRGQLVASTGADGLAYALGWIKHKLDNQIAFLSALSQKRPAKRAQLGVYLAQLQALREKLQDFAAAEANAAGVLRGLEGAAGRSYFEALSRIQPEEFPFQGRSRQPAKDEFNAILNYCYGVLYGLVERACMIAGLEPYLGFLHTDNYNKKSLVFDLIEPYRIWAEETTVFLFSQRQVKKDMFGTMTGGKRLNQEGKKTVITAFNERLDGAVLVKGRKLSRRHVMQFDCQAFAQELLAIDLKREPEEA